MPKLQNVTEAHVAEVVERAEDLSGELADIAKRIEHGYCDELMDPMGKLRSLLNLVRNGGEAMSGLMFRAEMDRQKRELEQMLQDRKD